MSDRIETIFGDSISAIEQHDGGVRTRFEHAPERDFDLVIGADGLHSRVRELVFGPQSRFEKQLGYRIAIFEAEGYRPRDELVYVSYGMPGRQVSRFAMRGDRTLFLFVFATEYMPGPEPHGAAECKALLTRVFAACRMGDAANPGRNGRGGRHLFRPRQPDQDGALVEGPRHAASAMRRAAVSLLAGEGTGLAMAEAYVLAGELHRAGLDYAAAFDRYEQRLRPFIEGQAEIGRRTSPRPLRRKRLGAYGCAIM